MKCSQVSQYITVWYTHNMYMLMECLQFAFSVAKQQDAAQPHITAVNDDNNGDKDPEMMEDEANHG